jgi:hypothetical protein
MRPQSRDPRIHADTWTCSHVFLAARFEVLNSDSIGKKLSPVTARRVSNWLRRSLLVVGLGTGGLVNASGCSESDSPSDCESPQANKSCSRPDLLCGVGSCNIAQCHEGRWCTAIVPSATCKGPTPPPGFCPPSAPDVGASCAATDGTTCAYPCAGGTIYSACNDGVFCNVYTCES